MALAARVRAFLDELAENDDAAPDTPVLSHTDFKLSNLHVTPAGELVVLDWEFAWAGPRLLDIGQLLRWHPPESFVQAFASAYRDGGGLLVDGWRRFAAIIDLGTCSSSSRTTRSCARPTTSRGALPRRIDAGELEFVSRFSR